MPRRERPKDTTRSEHWMRVAANEAASATNRLIIEAFHWNNGESITWLSPVASDDYAEYYDQAFLDLLEVGPLKYPLSEFWPASGPRWDGLARTDSGKIILVEAKAYIEEAVDYRSKASPGSLAKISAALEQAKTGFGISPYATWDAPYYQYANRLAHLYFLHQLNGLDAYLLFLYFADAPDVPEPCTEQEWQGAVRLLKKSLGLGSHPYRDRVATVVWSVGDMPSDVDIRRSIL